MILVQDRVPNIKHLDTTILNKNRLDFVHDCLALGTRSYTKYLNDLGSRSFRRRTTRTHVVGVDTTCTMFFKSKR